MTDILIEQGSQGVVTRYQTLAGWGRMVYEVDVTPLAPTDLLITEDGGIVTRYQDMDDGTWARVVSINGE